jgi:hypothetical protein
LVGAVDEADYSDDRCDTNDHADQRKHTAELVRPEAGRRYSYGL